MKNGGNMIYRNCNLCGNDNAKIIHVEDGYNIVKCKECGFIYVNPIPTSSENQKYYEHYLPSLGKRGEDFRDWVKKRRLLKYRKRKAYSNTLKYIKARVPEGKLLDIGCSVGSFLEMAKQQGYEVYGIDISKDPINFLKTEGYEVFLGTTDEVKFDDSKFSVVTMWEVLEHLRDPLGQLMEVHRILKDAGLLVIEVPNFYTQLLKTKILNLLWSFTGKKYYYGLLPEIHYNHFTPKTIKKMLLRAGFGNVEITVRDDVISSAPPIYVKELKRIWIPFSKKNLFNNRYPSWTCNGRLCY